MSTAPVDRPPDEQNPNLDSSIGYNAAISLSLCVFFLTVFLIFRRRAGWLYRPKALLYPYHPILNPDIYQLQLQPQPQPQQQLTQSDLQDPNPEDLEIGSESKPIPEKPSPLSSIPEDLLDSWYGEGCRPVTTGRAWLWTTLCLPDKTLLSEIGLDGFLFLMTLKYLFYMLLYLSLASFLCLLPLYSLGNAPHDQFYLNLSILHLEHGSDWFWIPLVITYCFVFFILYTHALFEQRVASLLQIQALAPAALLPLVSLAQSITDDDTCRDNIPSPQDKKDKAAGFSSNITNYHHPLGDISGARTKQLEEYEQQVYINKVYEILDLPSRTVMLHRLPRSLSTPANLKDYLHCTCGLADAGIIDIVFLSGPDSHSLTYYEYAKLRKSLRKSLEKAKETYRKILKEVIGSNEISPADYTVDKIEEDTTNFIDMQHVLSCKICFQSQMNHPVFNRYSTLRPRHYPTIPLMQRVHQFANQIKHRFSTLATREFSISGINSTNYSMNNSNMPSDRMHSSITEEVSNQQQADDLNAVGVDSIMYYEMLLLALENQCIQSSTLSDSHKFSNSDPTEVSNVVIYETRDRSAIQEGRHNSQDVATKIGSHGSDPSATDTLQNRDIQLQDMKSNILEDEPNCSFLSSSLNLPTPHVFNYLKHPRTPLIEVSLPPPPGEEHGESTLDNAISGASTNPTIKPLAASRTQLTPQVKYNGSSSAIVVLDSAYSATLVSKCPLGYPVSCPAPPPSLYLYKNCTTHYMVKSFGRYLSHMLFILVNLLYSVPVSLILSLNTSLRSVPGLGNLLSSLPKWMQGVIEGSIAPLLLSALLLLMPYFLQYLINTLEVPSSKSELDRKVFFKLSIFLYLQTFLVTFLSGPLLSFLLPLLRGEEDVGDVLHKLIASIQLVLANRSSFYMNLIFLKVALEHGMNLSELIGLAIYPFAVKTFRSFSSTSPSDGIVTESLQQSFQRKELDKDIHYSSKESDSNESNALGSLSWVIRDISSHESVRSQAPLWFLTLFSSLAPLGLLYPALLLILPLCLTYAVISPVLLFAGSLYYGIGYLVHRYNWLHRGIIGEDLPEGVQKTDHLCFKSLMHSKDYQPGHNHFKKMSNVFSPTQKHLQSGKIHSWSGVNLRTVSNPTLIAVFSFFLRLAVLTMVGMTVLQFSVQGASWQATLLVPCILFIIFGNDLFKRLAARTPNPRSSLKNINVAKLSSQNGPIQEAELCPFSMPNVLQTCGYLQGMDEVKYVPPKKTSPKFLANQIPDNTDSFMESFDRDLGNPLPQAYGRYSSRFFGTSKLDTSAILTMEVANAYRTRYKQLQLKLTSPSDPIEELPEFDQIKPNHLENPSGSHFPLSVLASLSYYGLVFDVVQSLKCRQINLLYYLLYPNLSITPKSYPFANIKDQFQLSEHTPSAVSQSILDNTSGGSSLPISINEAKKYPSLQTIATSSNYRSSSNTAAASLPPSSPLKPRPFQDPMMKSFLVCNLLSSYRHFPLLTAPHQENSEQDSNTYNEVQPDPSIHMPSVPPHSTFTTEDNPFVS